MFEYGMSCPVSTSVFISQFSTKSLPYVYLFIVPLNFVIVSLYNRIILSLGVYKTFILTLILISSIHLLCAVFADTFPLLIFFQYAFKDIYILLLFKQLWSMIHATMDVSKAKYLYTLPFLVGSLGAIIGSIVPALLAISVGSLKLFYLTPCVYLFLYLFYKKAFSLGNAPQKKEVFSNNETGKLGGFSLIRKSRYLMFILCLVLFMQLSVTLVHFQFNLFLEKNFESIDLRTEYMGKMHFMISSISIILQAFVSVFLIQFLGLKRSHLFVPLMLLVNSIAFLIKPALSTISFLYISIKSIDFSFFCLIREKLYVPLTLDEKYRAKAIIDVFVYRSSKAIASFLLLFFQWQHLQFSLTYFSNVIFVVWIAIIYLTFKEKKKVSLESV